MCCGKPHAQIHHVKAVGKRNRNKVVHRLFPFASLCWVHHNIAHAIGEIQLINEFVITPVYLDKEALIKIGIMSNAQIVSDFDQKYEKTKNYLIKHLRSDSSVNSQESFCNPTGKC
ncbi:MAG: putative HNHc nuclease [Enterococcus casseliflavus]